MNDQANAREPHDEDPPRKSRLDLEVEEILRKSDNVRPFPNPRSRPAKATPSRTGPGPTPASIPPVVRKALDTPLLLALGFAILALMVSSASPLLATLFALAAVVFVLFPVIQRYRRPSAAPETKMWRGREIDSRPTADSVAESVRQWWRSRQR
ncbi:MAG: hypothetical protein AVDCRST_MAG87-3955 [uncultured Thermomicrobiales bacterium]|uniref:Uncharacterized protein n=1 Tax=uncultured Thermomicrobiales bacterium TaxID=1645740 RepID=A0A6J4VRG1_9BACT|nr:MAG: hypothetical protein AVDCRST_MAG87-3955 [uncultured Thermomicrobiales bacterium]